MPVPSPTQCALIDVTHVRGCAFATVVDVDRERGAVEVRRERKPEILERVRTEAVVVVIGVDGGEVVCAHEIIEIGAGRLGRCGHRLELDFGEGAVASGQVLRHGDRSIEIG